MMKESVEICKMNSDVIYIQHKHLTVENFEDNQSVTVARGKAADNMTRRDAAWWTNHKNK
jgi:hypothetical protein